MAGTVRSTVSKTGSRMDAVFQFMQFHSQREIGAVILDLEIGISFWTKLGFNITLEQGVHEVWF